MTLDNLMIDSQTHQSLLDEYIEHIKKMREKLLLSWADMGVNNDQNADERKELLQLISTCTYMCRDFGDMIKEYNA